MSTAYPVIGDWTPQGDPLLEHPDKGTGLLLERRSNRFGLAYGGTADPFPDSMLIDESEWFDRIAEREKNKTTMAAFLDSVGLQVEDQAQTNFCWGNAPTHNNRIVQAKANNKVVNLSPASVCARLTNFRNQGGWGKEALAKIAADGQNTVDEWPHNAISRQYDTPATRQSALIYRVTEWWELEPGNVKQLISCLLHGFAVCVGLNWWSHEVTFIDPVVVNNAIGCLFDNSWGMSYGTKGRSVLQGSKMKPDDAVAARVPMAA